jgi:hypothetical protein
MLNRIILLAVPSLLVFAGQAVAWTAEIQRGIDLYAVDGDDVSLSLVCDPKGVYGGDETALSIAVVGDGLLTGTVVITFISGAKVELALDHGRIAKRDLDPAVWATLLGGLSSERSLSVLWNGQPHVVETGEQPGFSCT